jgi:hypothetical protein
MKVYLLTESRTWGHNQVQDGVFVGVFETYEAALRFRNAEAEKAYYKDYGKYKIREVEVMK